MRFVYLTMALIVFGFSGVAAAQTPPGLRLVDQQTQLVSLAAGSAISNIYLDLPASVTRFKVELSGAPGSGDVDLFMRQAQDFPALNSYGKPLTDAEISQYAQFWSISDGAAESILVSAASSRPPTAGRYFLTLVNYGGASTATLRLTQNPPVTPTQIRVAFDIPFQCPTNPPATAEPCECNLAPWNDPSPAGFTAPGNPGATLGEKRRNAVNAAAQSLANQISSEAPILVRACWSSKLKTDDTRAVLAAASPDDYVFSSPQVERGRLPFLSPNHTIFAIAPALRAAGAPACQVLGGSCVDQPQITIFFNSLIDTPEGLGTASFYYGTTGLAPARDVDFASVATHELTHGLGYLDLLSDTGEEAIGLDDAFSRHLINSAATLPKSFARMTTPERLAATTSNSVQWAGPFAVARSGGTLKMYAPGTVETGSSLSHLDSAAFGQELMAPSYSRGNRNLGVALGQLFDIGFATAAKTAPVAPKTYAGNWYDPSRSGHGLDIQPAGRANGFDRVFVTVYSYDAQGLPEYYLSIGNMVDGTYVADAQPLDAATATGLSRYRGVNGVAQIASDFVGNLRIDFNDAAASEPCGKGSQTLGTGVMRIKTGSDAPVDWCLEQLVAASSRPGADYSGHWYDENNPGWGVGIVQALSNGKVITLATVYYFDAAGVGRWAYAQSNDFTSGQDIPMFQRNGYCRSCPFQEAAPIPAGTMRLTLGGVDGLRGQGSKISFNVTLQGGAGGAFSRTDAPLVRLVERPRELQ